MVEQLRRFQDAVQILVTSRFLPSIHEELDDFEQLGPKSHRSDIELFTDRQIRKNKHLQKVVQKKPTLRLEITEGVVRTAGNMYLILFSLS